VTAYSLFVACLGFIERLWQRHELKRTARQWDERERLLDRPVATPQDIVESQEHIEHLSQENEGVGAEVGRLDALSYISAGAEGGLLAIVRVRLSARLILRALGRMESSHVRSTERKLPRYGVSLGPAHRGVRSCASVPGLVPLLRN